MLGRNLFLELLSKGQNAGFFRVQQYLTTKLRYEE